jgi:hypothetical protein
MHRNGRACVSLSLRSRSGQGREGMHHCLNSSCAGVGVGGGVHELCERRVQRYTQIRITCMCSPPVCSPLDQRQKHMAARRQQRGRGNDAPTTKRVQRSSPPLRTHWWQSTSSHQAHDERNRTSPSGEKKDLTCVQCRLASRTRIPDVYSGERAGGGDRFIIVAATGGGPLAPPLPAASTAAFGGGAVSLPPPPPLR